MKYKVTVNNKEYIVEIEPLDSNVVSSDPFKNVTKIEDKPVEQVEVKKKVFNAQPGNIVAPMSGEITKIYKKIGDKVEYGEVIIDLEAMKMNNNIISEVSGTIKDIKISVGDNVKQGDLLIVVE